MGRAILNRQVEQVEDIAAYPGHSFADVLGHWSVMAVPMLRHDVPLGAITIGRSAIGPFVDTQVALLQTFAEQAVIAITSAEVGAIALLVLDGAGWHSSPRLNVPKNIVLLPLPPYAPELNPMENVWEFMRGNDLSHRVWDGYKAIIVSEVARRWQVCSQQVFGWRRAARQDVTPALAKPTDTDAPCFVPIVAEAIACSGAPSPASAATVIEVRLAGAVVRVGSDLNDAAPLTAVLRAVRAPASRS